MTGGNALTPKTDPVLRNSRREAIVIALAWLISTVYSCGYCYLFGYSRPDRPLGPQDIHPILGMPSWVFWGIMAPWAVASLFTFWFAGFVMKDDDLGKDHAPELESDLREGGLDE
jgi:hypothetical protein